MKKISMVIAVILLSTALFSVTVNPSLDGRAVVADRGVFPSGNYGKAPGYLPGDTVIVTNHSTGFAIEVMILSTSDASEGIAILLSPEAAEKLNIIRGKDVYVKIQKKQAVPFEKVLTAADNDSSKNAAADSDKNPSKVLEDSPELLQFLNETKTAAETNPPKVIEVMPEETASSESQEETAKPETAEPFILEEQAAAVLEEEKTVPVLEEPPVEEAAVFTEEVAAVEEDIIEPDVEEAIVILEETVAVEEHIEAVPEEAVILEETAAVEEHIEAVPEEAVILEETAAVEEAEITTDPILDHPVLAVEEILPPVEETMVIEEYGVAALQEEVIEVQEEEAVELSQEPGIIIEEPVVVVEDVEPRNIFEEIIGGLGELPELIPAEENPPEVAVEELDDVLIIEPEPVLAVTEPIEIKVPALNGIDKYVNLLTKTESLKKNAYYIQIATLREIESIDNVVSAYGSKYPLNLIQVDTKYQVLVGPFSDDEYAAVYERFRQKEFKDAFVKKIK